VVNELERRIGTYLYGRRMYQTMAFWESAPTGADDPPVVRDYASIWRSADKVVYSTTLTSVSSGRTRIESAFVPGQIAGLKASASRDLSIGGATLAGRAIRAGLVDEYQLFLCPVIVGGGTRALPTGAHAALDLVEQHRFDNGTVQLHYRLRH